MISIKKVGYMIKKFLFVLLSTSLVSSTTFSKTVYVNGVTGSDSNDGSSWDKAYKTIQYANGGSRTTSGDNIWIAGGTIYELTSAQSNTNSGSTSIFQNSKNWYGGFKGNETSLSQRPLEDLDKNGIVELWEFKFPSELNFNLEDATGIGLGAGDFNGFTISAQAVYNSRFNYVLAAMSPESRFTNNTIRNVNVICNMANGDTWGAYTPFFRVKGIVSNCLFEKNSVKINALNYYCYPFLNIEASNASGSGTKFQNSIIRNNKVVVDYSKSEATNNGMIKGLILNINPAKSGEVPATVIANCVITNNEMEYLPSEENVSGSTLAAGSTITILTQNNKECTDSVLNCTVVNNKGIRIKSAGIYISYDGGSFHYVINNIFYNNQNSRDGQKFVVDNMQGSVSSGVGVISNNFTNGGALKSDNDRVVNQDNTLLPTMTLFKSPATTIGIVENNSANWSLAPNSYLGAKGVDLKTNKFDVTGKAYKNPRAVGAYEL